MNASIRRIAAAATLFAAPALIALGVAAGANADTGSTDAGSQISSSSSVSQRHMHHHHAQFHAFQHNAVNG